MDLNTFSKSHNWGMPTVCECCGSPLELDENHTHLTCPNSRCSTYDVGRLGKWIGVLEIKDLGLTTIEKIYEAGIFKKISDYYTADYSKIAEIDGLGMKSAQKFKSNIDAKRQMPLAKFIAGFYIQGLGERQIQKIIDANQIESYFQLLEKKPEQLVCEGIGLTTATKLYRGLASLEAEMRETLKYVEITKKEEPKVVEGGKLSGMSFCFTGKACMPRAKLQEIVTANGGENWGGVKKGLTYLVTDDTESGSAKNKKAKELGTIVISSTAFLDLVK